VADVTVSGPIFDGRAVAAVARFCEDAQSEVAQQGLADVHEIYNARIRNPTPYYETQLTMEIIGADAVVHDRGIIYGPWLNGTGTRNATTRFKGYAGFRITKQQLPGKVPGLIEPILARYLPEMG